MKTWIIAALLALATAAWAAPASDHAAERAAERTRADVYKAFFPDLATARKAAVTLHGRLLETEYARGWQIFELDAESTALLLSNGYRLEPAVEFIERRTAFLAAIDTANTRRAAGSAEVGVNAIPGYTCYETVEETFAAAQAMAAARPDLASWFDAGDSWQKSVAQGGYDMGVLKLTNKAVAGVKPRLFVSSAIHAREYVTAPLALAFARWLFDGYGKNAEATWILDHHEIHLMLQANPDGRKKAEAGLSWRKNTNTAYCAPQSNSRGADLNRNFGFSWNSTNGQGSSGNQCDLTYRGPTASSEPETRAIEAYMRSLWADQRGPGQNDPAPDTLSGLHIDLHSYSQLVLWSWGNTAQPAPNATALQTLGRRFAFFNGHFPEQSIGLYPTDGTSDGPSYGELGVPAFTFELGTSFFQDCASYSNDILPKNLEALKYAAKIARAPYQLPSGPRISAVVLPGAPVAAGALVDLTASADDGGFSAANGVESVQNIASAEYFVDTPPWIAGARPVAMTASDGAFDASVESVRAVMNTAGLANGRHLVFVRASDASGQAGPVSAGFLDIGVAPPPAEIKLSVAGTPRNRRHWDVALTWSGAAGANVDIRRNDSAVAVTANDGNWSETRGKGTWMYQVCEAGSTVACSPKVSITF
jgi:carboxypeptidase T